MSSSRSPTTDLPSAGEIQTWVSQTAARCSNREEFLQQIAARLLQWMSAAIVAVEDASWDQARMLVRDETIAGGIDRETIRGLLASASPNVTTASVPCDHSGGGLVMAGKPLTQCSAMTAELMADPERASVLVVHSDQRKAEDVLPSMKALATCVAAIRETSFGNPDSFGNSGTPTPANTTSLSSNPSDQSLSQLAAVRTSLRHFHSDLDPTGTAYRIAAELPRLLPCDRAVVLMPVSRKRRNPKYRVAAISGSSVVDRRSPLVRTMNQLASRLAVLGEAMVLPSNDPTSTRPDQELPPQLTEPLEDYLDESGALSVVVLPIFENSDLVSGEPDAHDDHQETEQRRPTTPMAMILLETFNGEPSSSISPAMTEISHEASTAIGNALYHDGVFALPLRRPMAGVSRRIIRNWIAAIFLCLIGLAAASWFIRVDHHVVATGLARPSLRQAIFAGVDGTVDEILVEDASRVVKGDVLVRLENPEIQRESETLTGQLATATQKLASLRSMQLAGSDDPREVAQNVIEQSSIENEIETLRKRIEINATLKHDLTIRSPIDGVVVGWRLNERLTKRPVSRGDRLFAVVAPEGDWELDLHLEESKAGEILQRYQEKTTVPIRFAIQTRPTETFQAELTRMGGVARRHADGRNVVDVIASIQDTPEGGFRTDAEVTAKLVCGKRRLVDSWTEEAVAWFYRNIVFRFSYFDSQ